MTPRPTPQPGRQRQHSQLHSVSLAIVAVLLVANAAIHLYLTPMHLAEAPYVGGLFLLLSVVCLGLAVLVVAGRPGQRWVLTAGTVSLAGLVAYVASRTVGLPQIRDDIGNWAEPLGLLTMLVEVTTIVLAAPVLRLGLHAPTAGSTAASTAAAR